MSFKKGHIPWNTGKKTSDEIRRKLSIAGQNRIFSLETRKKLSERQKGIKNHNFGKYHSEETKRKISIAGKGRKKPFGFGIGKKHSEEAKKKMSEIAKKDGRGRWLKGRRSNHWKGGISKDWAHYNRKRRNLEMNAGGSHTFGEWELQKKQYGYICPCCKKPEPEIKLTEDHIIPLSKGGSDYIENIQPLCSKCNSIKHTKIIKF